jgi:hypothetical protein
VGPLRGVTNSVPRGVAIASPDGVSASSVPHGAASGGRALGSRRSVQRPPRPRASTHSAAEPGSGVLLSALLSVSVASRLDEPSAPSANST